MKAACLALVAAAGCMTSPTDTPQPDQPQLWLELDASELAITLVRGFDHDVAGATASVNNIAIGAPPEVTPGRPATLDEDPTPALATFRIAASLLTGPAVHVQVRDEGGTFTADVADLTTPRTVTVLTALDQPLTGSESIAVASNVASDTLIADRIGIVVGGQTCSISGPFVHQGDAWTAALVPGFTDWSCGERPAPGTTLDATLDLVIDLGAQATCSAAACTIVRPLGAHFRAQPAVTLHF